MTIVPAEEDFDLDNVTDYEESEDENVLAKIVRVRDHDFERARFSLDNDSKVRIYAIGEGKPGRMYDYGWIEDAESGRVVWEMSYRKTDHAGGARKNRLYNQVISLEAGEYIVFYETDDSHSFNDWNASPPYDPINWGITVYRVVD